MNTWYLVLWYIRSAVGIVVLSCSIFLFPLIPSYWQRTSPPWNNYFLRTSELETAYAGTYRPEPGEVPDSSSGTFLFLRLYLDFLRINGAVSIAAAAASVRTHGGVLVCRPWYDLLSIYLCTWYIYDKSAAVYTCYVKLDQVLLYRR